MTYTFVITMMSMQLSLGNGVGLGFLEKKKLIGFKWEANGGLQCQMYVFYGPIPPPNFLLLVRARPKS